MKGATLVSDDANLMALAGQRLSSSPELVVAVAEDLVQVTDTEGRLYSLFGNAKPDAEWQTDVDTRGGALPAGWSSMHGYAVECRWEDLFVDVTERIVETVSSLWVVDGDGVLWSAGALDSETLRL